MNRDKIILVAIGEFGSSLHYEPKGSMTGYLSSYVTDVDKLVADHGKEFVENCPIIDKRDLYHNDAGFTRKVFNAPLMSTRCKDDAPTRETVDKFFGAAVIEANRGNIMSVILAKHMTDKSFTGLSEVSPWGFVKWWKDNGAKVGMFREGRVHWDEPSK